MPTKLPDRAAGGRLLAPALAVPPDAVLVALLPGGLAVAGPIAEALALPLGTLPVRKVGLPGYHDVVFGAVTCEVQALNQRVIRLLDPHAGDLHAALARARALCDPARLPALAGRPVVLVDDGIASGTSMAAAIAHVQALGARTVVVATPVCSPGAHDQLAYQAERVVALMVPPDFVTVPQFYETF